MAISPGATADRSFTVTDADTALALGSGDVPVLGTPRLIAWCEAVTVAALGDGLDEGQTTVGYRIRVDHLAPTPVGSTVEAVATVAEVDGRQVTLEVSARDSQAEIGRGTIIRVVVDRDQFLARTGGR